VKIVVLDGYTENPGDLSWDGLKALGELTVHSRTAPEQVVSRIGEAEIVFTNKVKITAEVLQACPKIRYIGVLATGYDVVDVKTAAEKGIVVTNIPTYGTQSVAQFVFALLLEICHHVGHHSEAVYDGRWSSNPDWCFWDYPLIELAGMTMGIIGYGRIGQATGRLAKAFGMKVLANDKYQNEECKSVCEYVSRDRIFAESDVIVLHCPLFPDTEKIICKENIAKMKDGVILINNSRGGLVNEADLAEALKSRKIRAAGLDVVSTEPISEDNPLLKAKHCLITPHISWASRASRTRLMNIAVENLQSFLNGNPVNVVNKK